MSDQFINQKVIILETLPKTEETAVIVTINFVCGTGKYFPKIVSAPIVIVEKPKKTKSK